MSELDKMQKIINLASTEIEKHRLQEAQEIIAASFKAMISCAGEAIKRDGKLVIPSLKEADEALQLFRQAGAKCSITFPIANTPHELKQYLLQWGMEIVTRNR